MFGSSVSLFISLFATFWPVFKGSLCTLTGRSSEKVACRWSTIDRNDLEARNMLVLTQGCLTLLPIGNEIVSVNSYW